MLVTEIASLFQLLFYTSLLPRMMRNTVFSSTTSHCNYQEMFKKVTSIQQLSEQEFTCALNKYHTYCGPEHLASKCGSHSRMTKSTTQTYTAVFQGHTVWTWKHKRISRKGQHYEESENSLHDWFTGYFFISPFPSSSFFSFFCNRLAVSSSKRFIQTREGAQKII